MDSLNLLNQFMRMISLAVCFSIVLLSIQHPYQNEMVVRRARIFIVPLVIYLINALNLTPDFSFEQVYWLGESLILFLAVSTYWEKSQYLERIIFPFLGLPIITTATLLTLHNLALKLIDRVPQPHYLWTLLISLGGLYYINKRKKVLLRLFFYGSLLLVFSYAVQFFYRSLYMPEVSVTLKIMAYFLWAAHFSLVAREESIACRHELSIAQQTIEKTTLYASENRESKLSQNHRHILESARRDGLTGALNRISIMDLIENQINNNKDQPFVILMFNIDHFKQINDHYGHAVGDLALKQLAETAENVIRNEDQLGRYGGDEFIIMLPGLNLAKAKLVAERLRQKVQALIDPDFSISIGIAVYPKDGISVIKLIENANRAMADAKRKGGNTVSHENTKAE
ncbi:MAG: GGDEF domain-containing protein [Bacillota bacterium]|nr:GGDEF domain-containing protein [Bacillota bacterium]